MASQFIAVPVNASFNTFTPPRPRSHKPNSRTNIKLSAIIKAKLSPGKESRVWLNVGERGREGKRSENKIKRPQTTVQVT